MSKARLAVQVLGARGHRNLEKSALSHDVQVLQGPIKGEVPAYCRALLDDLGGIWAAVAPRAQVDPVQLPLAITQESNSVTILRGDRHSRQLDPWPLQNRRGFHWNPAGHGAWGMV